MANKALFDSAKASLAAKIPETDAKNSAGGVAYAFTAEHGLAQFASTGTFNGTYYTTPEQQLDGVKRAADGCSPEFIAKTALWARTKGFMKDMPAALCVMLSKADPVLLDRVFDRVIDNGKMLRNFVQLTRSGAFGRRSMGSGPCRLVQRWFDNRTDDAIFRASIGNAPSLGDILKLTHVTPRTEARKALFGYLIGRPEAKDGEQLVESFTNKEGKACKRYRYDPVALPELVKHYEAFKKGDRTLGLPKVDFRMLTSLELTESDWAEIADAGRWQQTRMNLATYARHGVFKSKAAVKEIAKKLANKDEVRGARAFPYQLLSAYLATSSDMPSEIREALQDAMETATENVPAFGSSVLVMLDVSDSMNSAAVTGYRKGSTSKVTCLQAAALIASTIIRQNRDAKVIPFDTTVRNVELNPRDSVMTNTTKLMVRGGGTDCACALRDANALKLTAGLVIYLSDNESWSGPRSQLGTGLMGEWVEFARRNKGAKLVNIDMQPSSTSQTKPSDTVLNIGGFSDEVWTVIKAFVEGKKTEEGSVQQWVDAIKAMPLDAPVAANEAEDDEPAEGEATP